MSLPQSDELKDPALVAEVDLARAAAQQEAGEEEVGAHVGTQIEGEAAVTHLFEASKPGYRGWRWAATVASAGPETDVTVSEVVLLPGPEALVAPDWVPWENRVQAGDLGVGDLLPTAPDDPRLVPAYVESDDPAVEEVALEVGLGRVRVMARSAREDTAARWQEGEFGPRSDMARSAPAHCGTCGFYLPLAGSLRAAFGTCANELSPADAHVVHAEYGCGAHSEAEVEQVSPVLVANLIYDDALLDVEPLPVAQEPAAEPPPVSDAETYARPGPEVEIAADPDRAADLTTPGQITPPAPVADPVESGAFTDLAPLTEPGVPEATPPAPPAAAAAAAPSAEAGEAAETGDTAETAAVAAVVPEQPTSPEVDASADPTSHEPSATTGSEEVGSSFDVGTATQAFPAASTETGTTAAEAPPADATSASPEPEDGSSVTGPATDAGVTGEGAATEPGAGLEADATSEADSAPGETHPSEGFSSEALQGAEPIAPLEPLVTAETSVPETRPGQDEADSRSSDA
ncbi:DUF3027 domain-containing protein [Actinophytocola xanthii]|uniref:DUF3027 domain-containing protein n=1 Tax=Actinophytocola xanthii TaxID=1912961 RepID=UPI0009FAF3EB|nr:DUF3027 domain-containing protein [Actinophytocola xanthii]